MLRIPIYLTDEEQKVLKAIADRLGLSQSEIIRGAFDRNIPQYQKKIRLD
ncbi:MAG: ribbon-helix-helix protein, CopG family [Gemmatimonadota bacterium]|nr:MAG: ribbon-helix-helix protein, CopG family [Gemmatimonadota bacterium]